MLDEATTDPALRLATIEIAYAAALRTESAYYVLNYGLNLGTTLVFNTGDTARGLGVLEQALPQIEAVALDATDRVMTYLPSPTRTSRATR